MKEYRSHPGSAARSLAAVCLAALVSVANTAPVLAQQAGQAQQAEPAAYTTEQQRLNEQGVRAIIKKDYALAIALLEESAALGELNVTYLNLGRAYQKMGDCQAARKAYDKVEQAPKVASPSPALIAKKLGEYRDELDAKCEKSPNATKTADNTPVDEPTLDEPTVEEPRPDDTAATTSSETKPAEQATTPGPSPRQPAHPAADAGNSTWAWATTGAGVALTGAGVGALLYAGSLRDEINTPTLNEHGYVTTMTRADALDKKSSASTYQAIGIGMTITGALLTAGGVYLLVADDTEAPSQVSVDTGPDRIGVVWSGEF